MGMMRRREIWGTALGLALLAIAGCDGGGGAADGDRAVLPPTYKAGERNRGCHGQRHENATRPAWSEGPDERHTTVIVATRPRHLPTAIEPGRCVFTFSPREKVAGTAG